MIQQRLSYIIFLPQTGSVAQASNNMDITNQSAEVIMANFNAKLLLP